MEEKRVLLYGMRRERSDFFDALINGEVKGAITEITDRMKFKMYTIDTYNTTIEWLISERIKTLISLEAWQTFSKEWPTYLSPEDKKLFLWEEYYRSMANNPKNQLLSIYRKAIEEPEVNSDSAYPYYRDKDNKKVYIDFIKRGCKNGIDMAKNYPYVYIYFVLDGIDMKDVVSKTNSREYTQSRTSVELRYVFRNWEKLKDKVLFIENNRQVEAPWIERCAVKLWERYANQRNQRLFDTKIVKKQIRVLNHPCIDKKEGMKKQELKSFRSISSFAKQQVINRPEGEKKISRQRSLSI